jgi:hypothetical protein
MRRKISVYFKLEYAASDYVLEYNNIEIEERLVGHVALTGKINAYKILVVKPEGKRPLGNPRCR